MSGARVGILGGTFDPIHLGHIVPAEYAFNALRLDRLVLVPSGLPVHRPHHNPASGEDRLAMCRAAASVLPRFEVSDVEVRRREPSYTVLTIRHFREVFGAKAELFLLVGEDNLASLHTWRQVEEVMRLGSVVPMARPGRPCGRLDALRRVVGGDPVDRMLARRVDGPLVSISATEVRRRIGEMKSIEGLVPRSVSVYISSHDLYRPGGS